MYHNGSSFRIMRRLTTLFPSEFLEKHAEEILQETLATAAQPRCEAQMKTNDRSLWAGFVYQPAYVGETAGRRRSRLCSARDTQTNRSAFVFS
jgi:hypothetical protein